MKALVVGGTGFLGGAIAEAALFDNQTCLAKLSDLTAPAESQAAGRA